MGGACRGPESLRKREGRHARVRVKRLYTCCTTLSCAKRGQGGAAGTRWRVKSPLSGHGERGLTFAHKERTGLAHRNVMAPNSLLETHLVEGENRLPRVR